MKSLRPFLSGGDRRSLARAARALAIVRKDPRRPAELAALALDGDVLVSERALDLLEKLARERPDWIEPHKHLFLGPLADSDRWEIRLQIVRALPLFGWNAPERRRAVEILRRDVEHTQKFVRAWALDGLATLASRDTGLRPVVLRHLKAFERSGSKALQARAKRIRQRLFAK
jgi:hypothetical protein